VSFYSQKIFASECCYKGTFWQYTITNLCDLLLLGLWEFDLDLDLDRDFGLCFRCLRECPRSWSASANAFPGLRKTWRKLQLLPFGQRPLKNKPAERETKRVKPIRLFSGTKKAFSSSSCYSWPAICEFPKIWFQKNEINVHKYETRIRIFMIFHPSSLPPFIHLSIHSFIHSFIYSLKRDMVTALTSNN